MFGFGFWEIVIVTLAVIVFVKPAQLPKLFFEIGKIYGQLQQFNRSVRESMRQFERQMEERPESGGDASPRREPESGGADQESGSSSSGGDSGGGFRGEAERNQE